MKNVMSYFGVAPRYKCDGDLGIEIEVEGENLPQTRKYWRMEHDGSLRGEENMEYVLSKPLSLDGCRKALDYLDECYNNNNTVVDDTVRAGVHVHVNVQRLSIIELFNFITLYIIFEDILVKFCGEHREGNLFCLRTSDADWILYALRRAIKTGQWGQLVDDDLRYASFNVKALGTYGSLEFRAMRGTRDLDVIYKWAEILLSLREMAKQFNNPQDIIQGFSAGECLGFMERCFGDNFELLQCKDSARLVTEGMRRAQDIAYCVDWELYREKPVKYIGGLEFPIDVDFPDEPMENV